MSGATWWRPTRTTTTSGRIRVATACPRARSTVENSRTPTRTTRTLIRMRTSHIATGVLLAATATTPGTDFEPNQPPTNTKSTLQKSQEGPKLYPLLQFRLALISFWPGKKKKEKKCVQVFKQAARATLPVIKLSRLQIWESQLTIMNSYELSCCRTFWGPHTKPMCSADSCLLAASAKLTSVSGV